MIVGECEKRTVYNRYSVVSNRPGSVLETSGRIYRVDEKIQRVFYGYDEPDFICTHSASAGDRHRNQA